MMCHSVLAQARSLVLPDRTWQPIRLSVTLEIVRLHLLPALGRLQLAKRQRVRIQGYYSDALKSGLQVQCEPGGLVPPDGAPSSQGTATGASASRPLASSGEKPGCCCDTSTSRTPRNADARRRPGHTTPGCNQGNSGYTSQFCLRSLPACAEVRYWVSGGATSTSKYDPDSTRSWGGLSELRAATVRRAVTVRRHRRHYPLPLSISQRLSVPLSLTSTRGQNLPRRSDRHEGRRYTWLPCSFWSKKPGERSAKREPSRWMVLSSRWGCRGQSPRIRNRFRGWGGSDT